MITLIIGLFLAYSLYKVAMRYLCSPNFKGKTVWITGASSGIGEYLAYEFGRLQANLIISARNVQELQRVKSACAKPQKVKVLHLDMANYDEIQRVTKEVITQLESKNQKLDIVIENAGVSMRCLFKDYHFNNHIQMQKINVHGPYKHIQCFANHMIRNKSGHIVGVTSAAGKLSTSYRSSYSGTKSAFIGIMDSIRSELHQYNIAVTNIMPGYVNTNISKNSLIKGQGQKFGYTDYNIQHGLSAENFAKTTAGVIYRKESQAQISGLLSIPIMISLRNLCPDLAFWLMRRNHLNQKYAIENKSS